MFKKKKAFIMVILIFFISTLTAFAAQNCKEIKVFYRNIKIFVNNEKVALKDEPFVYNNRVFVPVRFLSESLNSFVSWDNENNTISISSFKDFKETNPLENERFVYGEILSINKEKRTLHIYQHIDDNTVYEETDLRVAKDVIIILQRNNKKINLDFEDLKIGDIVGMVVNKENEVRGIIIDS